MGRENRTDKVERPPFRWWVNMRRDLIELFTVGP